MSDVMEPMIHEDQLPGHESKLEPKPDWEPRYPGSGRLKDKVALVLTAGTPETANPDLQCSAHYFEIAGATLAAAWYGQGLRLVDLEIGPGLAYLLAEIAAIRARTSSLRLVSCVEVGSKVVGQLRCRSILRS